MSNFIGMKMNTVAVEDMIKRFKALEQRAEKAEAQAAAMRERLLYWQSWDDAAMLDDSQISRVVQDVLKNNDAGQSILNELAQTKAQLADVTSNLRKMEREEVLREDELEELRLFKETSNAQATEDYYEYLMNEQQFSHMKDLNEWTREGKKLRKVALAARELDESINDYNAYNILAKLRQALAELEET